MGKKVPLADSFGVEEKKKTKSKVCDDRMKHDKVFLHTLKKTIVPMAGMRKDGVRDKIVNTVHETVQYLHSREDFWKQLG